MGSAPLHFEADRANRMGIAPLCPEADPEPALRALPLLSEVGLLEFLSFRVWGRRYQAVVANAERARQAFEIAHEVQQFPHLFWALGLRV